MKFGHSIEYNKKNIFLPNTCRKCFSQTSSGPYLDFLKKALHEVKALQLFSSKIIFILYSIN